MKNENVELLPFEKKLTEVVDTDEGDFSLWCAEENARMLPVETEYDPHEALYEECCGYEW